MNETQSPLKILVVRPDRVGDVVLSTPVFDVLKRHYPKSSITLMIRDAVAPILRGLPFVDDLMIYEPEGRHQGVRGFFRLIREIREGGYRISVVLQSQWRVAAALFGAGVRYRVGPLSKPHSFLFYNRGVRQRRSQVEMHETDYNLQLLRKLGIRVGTRNVATRVAISDDARAFAREWLMGHGWTPERSRLIVVHPGMGGSALNWPENHYIELVRGMLRDGHSVLVTAGPTEKPLLDRVREGLLVGWKLQGAEAAEFESRVFYYGGPEIGPIDRLGGLMSWASLCVAPSTGPLHLAVALGKPVVTFYPPIRVQSAIRWGPYVADETRASVLVPEVYCGEDFKCRGNLCNYYPCMRTLTVQQALEQARMHLAREKRSHEEARF